MTVKTEQIIEIAGTVWSSFLGITLYEPDSSVAWAGEQPHTASATVHISGNWNGSVVLSCSTALARQAAATMFEAGTQDLNDEEVADALGELVNVIGGNLKCLLAEPNQLSLPTVTLGAAHVVSVPGASLLQHVQLMSGDEQLDIAVWTKRDPPVHGEHHITMGRTAL